MTLDKDYFKKLAHDIMLDVNDQEISELQNEFAVFLQQIDKLNAIDTSNVNEMVYPFEAETSFLREDVVKHIVTQEAVLSNVASSKIGQIWVPKVVK